VLRRVKDGAKLLQFSPTKLIKVSSACDVMSATRMKGIGDGQQDVQKYLPVAFMWEVVR
jgi:hypothetical protein